jgi:deazaflavin-dependent oxidoreductase (nitroreductase family)
MLLRIPTAIYRVHGGRLLGHRFLLLVHRGRHSGRHYRTVLEVVEWDPRSREAIVMSGFGKRADWYRNAIAGGVVEVQIAGTRLSPRARPLTQGDAARAVAAYERRTRLIAPVVRLVFSRLAGLDYDGSAEARARLVSILPLVSLGGG